MANAKIKPPPYLISNLPTRRQCYTASFIRPSYSAPRRRPCAELPRSTVFTASAFLVRSFSSAPIIPSAAPAFRYSISAAYSAKQHALNPSRNVFTYDPLVKVNKIAGELNTKAAKLARPKSGQDAFFVSKINTTGSLAFGVIDGVGGWESSGVNPADFAHSLGDYMALAATNWPEDFTDKKAIVKPRELLELGHRRVMSDDGVYAGGSTACVATVSRDGVLEVANLGDSGYAHFSPFQIKYVAPAQTHAFNTPYQLSKLPKRQLAQIAMFGGAKHYSELSSDAALSRQQLSHGDVLIFATDGVWDNLSPNDTLLIVSRLMVQLQGWIPPQEGEASSGASPDFATISKKAKMMIPGKDVSIHGLSALLAAAITHEAKDASLNEKRDGPFAKAVQRSYPDEHWHGGKRDDICTVVVVVTNES